MGHRKGAPGFERQIATMAVKKRHVFLGILLFCMAACVGISRMEFLKFRDQPERMESRILAATRMNATFHPMSGNQLAYVSVGNPSKPMLVLVHGSPGSCTAFMPFLQDTALLRRFQMVAVDRLGFGYSQFGTAEGSLKIQADAILATVRNLPAPYKLWVGHSLGAPVIVEAAIEDPDQVQGLMLVGGSVDPDLEPREWWHGPLNWPVVRWMLPPAFRVSNQEIMPLYDELVKQSKNWSAIQCPVAFVHGTDDFLVDINNLYFVKDHMPPQVPLYIDTLSGADHFILWTRMDVMQHDVLELNRLVETHGEHTSDELTDH